VMIPRQSVRTRLGGVDIPAGRVLNVFIGSANRDEGSTRSPTARHPPHARATPVVRLRTAHVPRHASGTHGDPYRAGRHTRATPRSPPRRRCRVPSRRHRLRSPGALRSVSVSVAGELWGCNRRARASRGVDVRLVRRPCRYSAPRRAPRDVNEAVRPHGAAGTRSATWSPAAFRRHLRFDVLDQRQEEREHAVMAFVLAAPRSSGLCQILRQAKTSWMTLASAASAS
jgi:hypothetical protein